MSDTVIRVEGLGKKYRIRHQRSERYTALRDVIADRAKALLRRRQRTAGDPPAVEDFWALKDVSFEVKRGDVLGIIGRNGAGKSTLLKVLSRITEPTRGRVEMLGRVANLLEVGTGFHPELTGRENIFLNGAILGMSRAEIRRKFDEIVAFAEVDRFLDTPVKRYSSGMYVRLAFAVAAHLDQDILIVDEVLAVGDAEFQKKCLGKMRDVSRGGRTVLFVSHNMAAVQGLCDRGVLLDQGSTLLDGPIAEVVRHYLESSRDVGSENNGRALSKGLELIDVTFDAAVVRQREAIGFQIVLRSSGTAEVISDLALLIHGPGGDRAALIDLRSAGGPYRLAHGASLVVRAVLPCVSLVENDYSIGLYLDAETVRESFMSLTTLSVTPSVQPIGPVPRDPQFRGVAELEANVAHEIVVPAETTASLSRCRA